jgi:hypothetical protein
VTTADIEIEVIEPDDPRAVRVAAIMRPASFRLVRDPLAAFTFDLSALDVSFPDLSGFEWP